MLPFFAHVDLLEKYIQLPGYDRATLHQLWILMISTEIKGASRRIKVCGQWLQRCFVFTAIFGHGLLASPLLWRVFPCLAIGHLPPPTVHHLTHLLLVELTMDIGWFTSSFTTRILFCRRTNDRTLTCRPEDHQARPWTSTSPLRRGYTWHEERGFFSEGHPHSGALSTEMVIRLALGSGFRHWENLFPPQQVFWEELSYPPK